MADTNALRKKRDRLITKINDHLDFLIGSVSTKGLASPAFHLTTKVDGVTTSRYIPIDLVPLVRRLSARHKTLKKLLKQLDDVNWLIIRKGEEL